MQNIYGREIMSKSSKDRVKLFDEIPIDLSTTLPLSPQPKIIPYQTTGSQLKIHANILPEVEIIKIQSPPVMSKNLNEISTPRDSQDGIKLKGQVIRKKYQYSMHCKVCKARYPSKSSLSTHMKKHSEMKEMQKTDKSHRDFICTECGCPHSSEDELNVHMVSALTSKNIQKCSLCPEKFWGSQCLEYHRIFHHNKELDSNCGVEIQKQRKSNYKSKIWECGVCKLKFSCNSKLKMHQLIHGSMKFKCSFNGCEKIFYWKNNLKRHRALCHSEHKPFQCPYCSRGFADKSYLISHLGDEKSEHCGICNEDFKSLGCLKHHNSISHGMSYQSRIKSAERRDLAKCKICSIYYLSKNLKLHELTHEEPKFKCPEIGCDKLFKRKEYVNDHINMVHKGIYYKCTFAGCEKNFKRKAHRTRHLKRVHKL